MTLFKQISSFMDRKDKIWFFLIVFLNLICSFLELIGLYSILSIVEIISFGEQGANGVLVYDAFYFIFPSFKYSQILIAILLSLVLLFAIKTFLFLFNSYTQNKYIYNFQTNLSLKLVKSYLNEDFEDSTHRNSSDILKNVSYDVGMMASALNAFLNFISQVTLTIFFVAYLFYIDLLITFIVLILLALFSSITILLTKKKIKRVSERLQVYKRDFYKNVTETFNCSKEIVVSHNTDFFVDRLDNDLCTIESHNVKYAFLLDLPKNIIEAIGYISILAALIVSILFFSNDIDKLIVKFSAMVTAVIKLLPAINSIVRDVNTITFSKASVNSVYSTKLIRMNTLSEGTILGFEKSLTFESVSFKYKNTDEYVLRNVNFSIKKGEFVSICGPSGSGKSTLIDILLGLLIPTEGRVLCDNVDIKENIYGYQSNIGYLPQNIYMLDDTIESNITFGIKNTDNRFLKEAIDMSELTEFVDSLDEKEKYIVGENGSRISGGQKQRIGLARLFYKNAPVIILDESTSALDFKTEMRIIDTIKNLKGRYTIIMVTHRENSTRFCDRNFYVSKGELHEQKENN